MASTFIDTNIPMYAAGGEHPLRLPAQEVIRSIVRGDLDAVTDAEVFQEILYRYFAIGQRDTGLRIFDNFHVIMAGRILPVTDDDVRQARDLAEQYVQLSPRDLIHLGVMVRAQLDDIVTADNGFDSVREVRRISLASFPLT